MPRIRTLKSIMSGVLGSFVSRNNDVNGYWGIGILCLQAVMLKVPSISFNLTLSSTLTTNRDVVVVGMSERYGRMLQTLVRKGGISVASLQCATVTIEFGLPRPLRTTAPMTRGEPFVCTLSILDDRGRSLSVSLASWCAPHDPRKETRSCRSAAVAN